MIKVAILGATGYAGCELVRLLVSHPGCELVHLASHSYAGKVFSEVYPAFKGICDQTLQEDDIKLASSRADVVFLALPAGLAMESVDSSVIEKSVVIDLGADFRLHDRAVYEEWYHMKNDNPLLPQAVYGLCEIYRKEIENARLIANPGCYTTCSILSLYPLVKNHLVDDSTIVIDAKSGTSGAGRGAKTENLFCEVNESIRPYGIANHRHTPEIEQELSLASGHPIVLQFTPHLVPMDRGILATCYARLRKGVSEKDVDDAYNEAYGDEHFIRLVGSVSTGSVRGSNFVDIAHKVDRRSGNIIVTAVLDNLVKGAAGQAVQNMNIVFGLDETTGLAMAPCAF